MEYLKITEEDVKDRDEATKPVYKGFSVSPNMAKKSTTYFMNYLIGIKPYVWQHLSFKQFNSGSRFNVFCTPRQVGKTAMDSVYSLNVCMFNTLAHYTTHGKTRVGIISKTEDQSKKVIEDIKNLIYRGDDNVRVLTKGKYAHFFSDQLDKSREASNSKTAITFSNGCKIISLPPTDKVRGYTFNLLILDEAAFFEDDNFLMEKAMPTIRKTDGQVIITSTPNGQKGFFFDIFDPFDTQENNMFKRTWLHYTMIEDKEELSKVEALKDLYYSTGRERQFSQEYEALFTVAASSFFDSDDVDAGIDTTLNKELEWSEPCDLGIDFGGMAMSKTVLTISTKDKEGINKLIYWFSYPKGKEVTLIDDIEELRKRFNIQRIIPDDCPEGYPFILEMEKRGWNVKPMSFKRDKVKKYVQFRAKLRQRKIKYPKNDHLLKEMKALEEIEGVRSTQIRKPQGGSDDMIDSLIMSMYYLIEDNSKLRFFTSDGEVWGDN